MMFFISLPPVGSSEMLSIRRRGSAGKWYVRGSVTLGDRSIDVTEFSTGTTDKAAARHLMGERERELREELMFGPRVVAKRAVIADAFDVYLSKPKRPNSSDILRVDEATGRRPDFTVPRLCWGCAGPLGRTLMGGSSDAFELCLGSAGDLVANRVYDLDRQSSGGPAIRIRCLPSGGQFELAGLA